MTNQYYTPTRVVFGEGAVDELVSVLKASKVLIHYGGSSAEKSGLLAKVRGLLDSASISYVELGGVKPNPRLSLVRKGIELCRKESVDFILAVGGGSVIDSAKAIAYGVKDDGNVWDFYGDKKREPEVSMPLGVILTISASGSEMSDSSVITNDEEGDLKRSCNSDLCRPAFALLDPTLTYTVSRYQSECGAVDIMMHTIERFFHSGVGLDFTDELAATLIKTTIEMGQRVLKDPCDYQARASLMWASSISHNGFMSLGNGQKGDWASHQLEHELSGMFDIAHGAGLAIVFPAWATYVYKTNPDRFARLGSLVFGLKETGDEGALKTIEGFRKVFKALEMPLSLKEAGIEITDKELEKLVASATFFGKRTLGAFKVLEADDMREIYKLCR